MGGFFNIVFCIGVLIQCTHAFTAVCVCVRSRAIETSITATPLMTILIPSFRKTTTTKDDAHLYVAIDSDDTFWLKYVKVIESIGKVVIVNKTSLDGRIPFNEITQRAQDDGAEYIVRVNDDTEFVTPGWVQIGKDELKKMDPPNVGVVVDTRDIYNVVQMQQNNIELNSNVIVLVLSARDNFNKRQVIRETWGHNYKNVVFIIGQPCLIPIEHRLPYECANNPLKKIPNNITQYNYDKEVENNNAQIKIEAALYGDVIILPFVDHYRGLPEKMAWAFFWSLSTNAKWMVKIDDDCIARINNIESYVSALHDPMTVTGRIAKGWKVSRSGKWAEPRYYNDTTYPSFPIGSTGYIISREVSAEISRYKMHFYQGEDVSFGIWSRDLNIPIKWINSDKFIISSNCHDNSKLIFGHDFTEKEMRLCFPYKDEKYANFLSFLSSKFTLMKWKEAPKLNSWWVDIYCPEVIEFYNEIPIIKSQPSKSFEPVIMHTEAAKISTCLLKIINDISLKKNISWFLHAGTHLASIVHGSIMPWDDDTDVFVGKKDVSTLIYELENFRIPGGNFKLKCVKYRNAFKLFEINGLKIKEQLVWKWPFIDMFIFEQKDGFYTELSPTGDTHIDNQLKKFDACHYDDVQLYFLGGLLLPGPSRNLIKARYNIKKCMGGVYSHRSEQFVHYNHIYNCGEVSRFVPFVKQDKYEEKKWNIIIADRIIRSVIYVGKSVRIFIPGRGYCQRYIDKETHRSFIVSDSALDNSNINRIYNISSTDRELFISNRNKLSVPKMLEMIPNMDEIEVNNNGINKKICWDKNTTLKVIEFNAERGKEWAQFVQMIRIQKELLSPDIIILNEMDIGMARSNNLHTTKMVAELLGYNYAWGIEFLELTKGTKYEQLNAIGKNELGLHGNAIISRFPLTFELQVRDPLDTIYYSGEPSSENAMGYEKRLGGRTGFIVSSTICDGEKLFIGTFHKLMKKQHIIKDFVKTLKNSPIIFAGDQNWDFCTSVGLKHADEKSQYTWPATCLSNGKWKGDIICSSMKIADNEHVTKPCVQYEQKSKIISDHAILSLSLKM